MTVSNNYAPVVTAANGVTTVFTASWNALSAANVLVQLLNTTTGIYTSVTQGVGSTQYQITALTPTSLVITFNTAPASGNNVIVSRNTAQAQTIPYTTSRGFQGSVEEGSFDALTNMVQEINDIVTDSIQVSIGDAAANLTLPIVSLRGGKFLGFDLNGNVVAITSFGTYRGVWASATQYNTSDIVLDGAAGANTQNLYYSTGSEVSGVWATDLAAGKWVLIINVASLVAAEAAAATSATAAATSAAAAAALLVLTNDKIWIGNASNVAVANTVSGDATLSNAGVLRITGINALTGAANLSPANANVTISPSGSGEVIINPAGGGTLDNVVIGGVTPVAGTFTDLSAGGGAFSVNNATGNVSVAVGTFSVTSEFNVNLSGGGNPTLETTSGNIILRSQLGNILIGNTADTFGVTITATNFVNITPIANVTINPSGSGHFISLGGAATVAFSTATSWTANGTQAQSLGSTGPSGAHATPQEWLTIRDNLGTTRYVPCF